MEENNIDSSPFVTAGSLKADYPLYIQRNTDLVLLNELRNGADTVVLGPRQTGKSSLKIRTMDLLQHENYLCAAVDFTGIKTKSDNFANTVFSFWFGVAKAFGLVTSTEDFKLLVGEEYVSEQVCKNLTFNFPETKLILFIDEADASTELTQCGGITFFDVVLSEISTFRKNLQFAFFGTALYSELFSENLIVNAPILIQLPFFTEVEIRIFAAQLLEFNTESLVDSLYCSTGGQPQLTQRICDALWHKKYEPEDFETMYANLMASLFATEFGMEIDTNLRAVEHTYKRYLAFANNLAETLHEVILKGSVTYNEFNFDHQVLLLTGMMRIDNQSLTFSNRLYRKYFSKNRKLV